MKSISICLLLMIGLIGCRKDLQDNPNGYLPAVQSFLKDSMAVNDYAALDFSRAVRTGNGEEDLYLLRIPFKGTTLARRFVLLQTSGSGVLISGRMVDLYREEPDAARPFNGHITIHTLGGSPLLEDRIDRGYIQWPRRHSFLMGVQSLQPDPYQMLPVVIVVASRTSENTFTYSDWISLYSFFNDGSYAGGGYYSPMNDAMVYGGGGSGDGSSSFSGDSGNDGHVYMDPTVWVDFEGQDQLPAIDVEKYLKCFSAIPDEGALCTIEIFADIPVDSDPNKIVNIYSGSPGHTFIQLKKSNGSKSAIQNIGFYPKLGWKPAITNAPIDGKLVDNGEHEFNASFKMSLAPQNFNSVLSEIIYLANFIRYDIDNYNCTDFALDVFNKTRRERLDIPQIHIPGNYPATGTRTPQGLYSLLRQMKNGGHPESDNITINIQKGWVAKSTGPCN